MLIQDASEKEIADFMQYAGRDKCVAWGFFITDETASIPGHLMAHPTKPFPKYLNKDLDDPMKIAKYFLDKELPNTTWLKIKIFRISETVILES